MNLAEIQSALTDDLLGRDDASASELSNAIRYAHRELQRTFNWRCMFSRRTGLFYPANSEDGVVVETVTDADDCKELCQVFLEELSGYRRPLVPATPNEANPVAAVRLGLRARAGYQGVPDLSAMTWYDRGRRVALAPAPASDLALTVDFYRWLAFYANNGATDWFSIHLPDALQLGAAYWLSKNFFEDDRAESFRQRFVELAANAYATDRRSYRAGLADSYSPVGPVPGPSRAGAWSGFAIPGTSPRTVGTATIGGNNLSVDVALLGLRATGKVSVWQEASTGGFVAFMVGYGTDKFTISVPSAPEVEAGDGKTFKFGWEVARLA
jgi:hypothetical protein